MDNDQTTPQPPPDQPPSDWAAGPASPKRTFPTRILALAIGGVAAVAIGAVAFTMLALRGTSDVIMDMVPGDATAYVTVYLDPAAGQKLNVRSLAQKFPALDIDEIDRRIDEFLDEALAESGLTSDDVRPWLGSQIGAAFWLRGTDEPDFAVLVASNDPAAAQAALDKVRSAAQDSGVTWTDEERGGVKFSSGSGGTGAYSDDMAYAMVDSTVVLAGTSAVIERIIDTAQGSEDPLASTERFTQAMESLPEENLGMLYVDMGAIIDEFLPEIEQAPDLPTGFNLGELDALQAFGMVVAAESDGILAHVASTLDPSKLSDASQRVLEVQPHQNAVLSFTPENAYGVMAASGLKESLEQVLEFAGEEPGLDAQLEQLGVPDAIDALSGDYGLEASPGGAGGLPAGAFLMGTTDEAAMQQFLGNLTEAALGALSGAFGRSSSQGDLMQPPLISEEEEAYKGVTITWFSIPELASVGVAPAYAVTDGMAIIASSPEEVKDLIDVRDGGETITSAPRFRQAIAHADAQNVSIFYVDIEAVVADVRDALSPQEQASFDADVRPNLDPLKAFIFTTTQGTNRSTLRMFLVIE